VLPWAAGILRDGGAVHYFAGGGGEALPLPLETLYHRELTITATYSSSPADLTEAFGLITRGAVQVERLFTHRVPLESLASGVDLMRRREALKGVRDAVRAMVFHGPGDLRREDLPVPAPGARRAGHADRGSADVRHRREDLAPRTPRDDPDGADRLRPRVSPAP
jgi:hypothetical protein